MLHLTPHTPSHSDLAGGDEEEDADEDDQVVQVSDTVAALVGRKIEELFVFWSRVAA